MIEPRYLKLNALFSDRVFRIPRYQRFYSWGKEQRDDLFNDLRDLQRKNTDRHHFMATIVCHQTGEKVSANLIEYEKYDVVDGQQRITTLVLLLKAIQLRLPENQSKKDIARMLIKDDGNLLLLQSFNFNQYLFNRYLQKGEKPKSDEIRTHADVNVADGIKEIEIFLDSWEDEFGDLQSLIRLILNRIGFVVYDTDDDSAVYTIFECLNSRGLAVDWLDKAKSILMGIAYELSESSAVDDKIQELNNLWGNIYNEIALVPIPGREILRTTATLFTGTGAGKPLSPEESIKKLRSYCKSAQDTITVSGWILVVTKKLVELYSKKFWGPIVKVHQARMLAVAILLADYLEEKQRERLLEQWERTSFRIYGLFRKDARTSIGDYIRLSYNIIKGGDHESKYDFSTIMTKIAEIGDRFPVEKAVDEWISDPRYWPHEDDIRYILWRYEEYLAKRESAEVNKELREKIWSARSATDTIEHVYPRNPEPGGPWDAFLGENQKHEDHVDRIGNLLLLPPNLNSEAGRRSFEKKKDVYKKAEGLRIVKDVMEATEWNLDQIEKREKDISKFLKEVFCDINHE